MVCIRLAAGMQGGWHEPQNNLAFHDAGHYYRPFCTLNSDRWHIWSSRTTYRQHLRAQMLGFLT